MSLGFTSHEDHAHNTHHGKSHQLANPPLAPEASLGAEGKLDLTSSHSHTSYFGFDMRQI